MSYEKQTWKDLPDKTTPFTAERMNHIEDGIEDVDINKVNIADIIDNLESTDTNKPLSANQGKILKNITDNLNKKANCFEILWAAKAYETPITIDMSNYKQGIIAIIYNADNSIYSSSFIYSFTKNIQQANNISLLQLATKNNHESAIPEISNDTNNIIIKRASYGGFMTVMYLGTKI